MSSKTGAAVPLAVWLSLSVLGTAAFGADDATLILEAARKGDVNRVATLARANPKLLGRIVHDDWLDSVIGSAAYAGQTRVVEYCLTQGVENRLMTEALCQATRADHLDICRLLISKGAPLNPRNGDAQDPLQVAVEKENVALVKLLLERGANTDTYGVNGATPLAQAAANGNKAIVNLLLAKDADVNFHAEKCTFALIEALWNGQEEIALRFLELDADPTMTTDRLAATWPLCAAAYSNCARAAKVMIERGADPKALDEQKWTALHWAATMASFDAAKVLIASGADVNARGPNKVSALECAVNPFDAGIHHNVQGAWAPFGADDKNAAARYNVVELLLANGADANSKAAARKRGTFLANKKLLALFERDAGGPDPFLAASGGDLAQVRQMLAKDPALAKKTGADDVTLLILAAQAEDLELAKELVRLGADVNAQGGDNKSTPLLMAMRASDATRRAALARLFLDKGADVTIPDKEGVTPLHVVAQQNDVQLIRELRAKGAKVDALTTVHKESPMYFAAESGAKDAIEEFRKMGQSIEVKDWQQRTPLLRAIEHGHADIAKLLLSIGADPNASTDWGSTPLTAVGERHDAGLITALVEKGAKMTPELGSAFLRSIAATDPSNRALAGEQLKYAGFLIEKCGAKVNLADRDGLPPLHLAVRRNAEYMVKFLLDNGADRDLQDKNGLTPLLHAATDSMKTLLKTYKGAGGK